MTSLMMCAIGILIAILCWRVIGPQRFFDLQGWNKTVRIVGTIFGVLLACLGIVNTSIVTVSSNSAAHLVRKYGTGSLAAGKIIATNGENGPQAKILAPGFHFSPFITVMNDVEHFENLFIPEGKYGYVTAKDGKPLDAGEAYAEAIPVMEFTKMIEDAEYFLSNGGKRGPQTTVLPPGTYRFNHYLFTIELGDNTVIDAGHVGVITSRVHSAVDFGDALRSEKPTDVSPVEPPLKVEGQLHVPVVPVGAIGVWVKALPPGSYRVNTHVYNVDLVDTRIQTWEYKGGWSKRIIDLKVDSKGEITQTERSIDMTVKDEKVADPAIIVKVESWEIPQEARALVQVTPEQAPWSVASVGTLEDIENDVLTPTIRSVLRSAVGGGTITVEDEVVNTDADGNEVERKLVKRTRKIQPLDLIDHREKIEDLVEHDIVNEGLKANITIREIRLGESGIPPELQLPRMREQLALGLKKAFQQEQIAQTERINSEKAKATADQQGDLVKAEIEVRRAEQHKMALKSEGEGERAKLEEIAMGQKAQVDVLGPDKVFKLRQFELRLQMAFEYAKTPEGSRAIEALFNNAHKLVPERVITVGGDTGGGTGLLATFGAILGDSLSPSNAEDNPATTPTDSSQS